MMFSRTLKRVLLESPSQLPPTFLLPWTASLTTVSAPFADHVPSLPPSIPSSMPSTSPGRSEGSPRTTRKTSSRPKASTSPNARDPTEILPPPPNAKASKTPSIVQLSLTGKELLPIMRAQGPHYITVHIHGKPYLVTQGDTVRLPFLMHGVEPGDILRLNRAIILGSRDYTLKPPAPAPKLKSLTKSATMALDPTTGNLASFSTVVPTGEVSSARKTSVPAPHFIPNLAQGKHSYIDDRLFVCRALVMGVESEPLRIKEKTKRRQRHIKKVKSKHRYTVLKIQELRIKDLEELENEVE